MSASVFLDTNILIYAIEDTMPLSARTAKARAVVAGTDWMISTQVAGGVLPRYDFETPGGPTFPRRGGRLDPALETLAGECRAATPSGFGAGTLRALSDWVLRRPDPIHRATCRLQGRVFGRPEQRTGLRKPDGPQSVNGGLVGGFLVPFDEFNGFVGEAVAHDSVVACPACTVHVNIFFNYCADLLYLAVHVNIFFNYCADLLYLAPANGSGCS